MEKDFYYRSIEFYYLTKKLSTNEIVDLNHPFVKEIPQHLYKYRKSGEEGRSGFYVGERKIYTASFNNQGDVFEGLTPATKQRIIEFDGEAMCKYYEATIIDILSKRFESIDKILAKQIFDIIIDEHFDTSAIYEKVKALVKKEELKPLKTTISAMTYLFEGLDTKMNNEGEFSKGMKMLIDINNLMGTFCMCDSCTKTNLWDKYADNYRGYCIEYDLTNPLKSKGSINFIRSLYPVTYVDKKDDDWFKPLFESTIATINIDGRASKFNSALIFNHWTTKTLCTKKRTDWSNEDEWRFIGKANKSYLGPLVSSIIVGHNIGKKDFEQVKKLADKNRFPIKITDIDYIKQEVVVRDINKDDIETISKRSN